MGKLTDKVAVVTGASKGIGAGIAKALAAEGAMVVVNYAASRSDADTVVADITAKGGKAYAIQADVSKSEDVERLIADTISTFGRIDVLVNNAGIYRFSPIEAVSEDDFHQHFNINVLGVLLVTKEAINTSDLMVGASLTSARQSRATRRPELPCMSLRKAPSKR
jgi:3-oxoacyl-[acyl-carrier protein] reductase